MNLFNLKLIHAVQDTAWLTGDSFIYGCALIAGVILIINWISDHS